MSFLKTSQLERSMLGIVAAARHESPIAMRANKRTRIPAVFFSPQGRFQRVPAV